MRRFFPAFWFAGTFVLVFAAVFAALQIDHRIHGQPQKEVLVLGDRHQGALINAQSGLVSPPDFRTAAKKIIPSVVSIDTVVSGEDVFSRPVEEKAATASGVVVSQDGYVVTNNHVILVEEGYNSQVADKVIVNYNDGQSEVAKIVGADPASDLAVLKVQRKDITPISIGDSSKLEIGQWVMALGNPLGYSSTLTVGVVSSLGRQLTSKNGRLFVDGIQTDAAINQGNSGGALCDATGNLIGINSSIASLDGGSIGIGFAIPVNRMKRVVADILKYGHARYGALGIRTWNRPGGLALAEHREALKQFLQVDAEPPAYGVVILQVMPDSPALAAGLAEGDVILTLNGVKAKDQTDYAAALSNSHPGDQLKLHIWSKGKEKDLSVTLAEAAQ